MVRKQLYLDEEQNRTLKRRAKELGISEAEFVRGVLSAALHEQEIHVPPPGDRRGALQAFLDDARRHGVVAGRPDGYRFTREAVYQERLDRWTRHE